MWKILQQDKPDDFVIGTGTSHTVRDFLEHALRCVGIEIEWKGAGTDTSIRSLSEQIKTIIGYSGEIRFDPSKPDGTPRKLLDISKIQALGWSPRITLDDGLKKPYAWYLSS